MHEPAAMTTAQRELIEEFGLLYEEKGGTRMTGRVSAWLLLCDPPVQSLTEIADGLGVSKAAVSGAARMLLQARLVERVGEPGQRGDFYRAVPIDIVNVLPVDHVHGLRLLLERALASVTGRDQTRSNYALMHDLHEFTVFVEAELPAIIEKWRRRRGDSTSPAASTTTHPDPDQEAGGTP